MTDVPPVARPSDRAAEPSSTLSVGAIEHWLRGERVLEIGADERTVRALLDRGVSITAITSDAQRFETARERLGGYLAIPDRLRMDLIRTTEWPFEDHTFDSIVVDSTTWHALVPHRLFAEMRRVLRPGGSLIIHAPYGRTAHGRHHDELYLRDIREAMAGLFRVRDASLRDGRLLALVEEETAIDHEPNEALLEIAESALRNVEIDLEQERARADRSRRELDRLRRHPVMRVARAARRTLRRLTGRGSRTLR